MNIVVCIKQVPDTTEVKIDPKTNTLIREGVQSIMNPFDAYAVEEGVRLKEKYGGKVIAITMGPPQAESVLREAISVGVDEGILVSDKAFAGSDTLATSYTLSAAIKKIGEFDIVLCGKQAIDGDTAQVGPGISVHLDIPQIAMVKKIREINMEERFIIAERMVEEGTEIIKSMLPVVLTVVKEINEPRMPSIKGKLRAKKAEIEKWGIKELNLQPFDTGLEGSPTQVVKVFSPPPRAQGVVWEDEPSVVAERLVEELKKLGVI